MLHLPKASNQVELSLLLDNAGETQELNQNNNESVYLPLSDSLINLLGSKDPESDLIAKYLSLSLD